MAVRLSAIYLFLVAFFPIWASAASILPSSASSTFPQCGFSCSVLTEAQTSCEGNPDQSTWVSCFCQSSMLTGLKSSGSVCPNCDSSDQSLLTSWYNNFCNGGGTISNPSPSSSAPSSTSSAVPTPSAHARPTWWSTHYQWVIMVIVLAIGFTVLALGGMWLKRRYDAKRPNLWHGDDAGASSSGGLYQRNSGVVSPPPAAWAGTPVPMQQRGTPGDSDTDVMPKAYRSRLKRF